MPFFIKFHLIVSVRLSSSYKFTIYFISITKSLFLQAVHSFLGIGNGNS